MIGFGGLIAVSIVGVCRGLSEGIRFRQLVTVTVVGVTRSTAQAIGPTQKLTVVVEPESNHASVGIGLGVSIGCEIVIVRSLVTNSVCNARETTARIIRTNHL